MNAYELADDLEGWSDDWLSSGNKKNVFKKHAKMLRQQADRIAELEKEKIRAYDNGAEVGQKPMAWISPLGNFYKSKIDAVKNGEQMISPLYTTPQIKELSDEEIRVFMAEMPHLTERKDLLMFARAILKKANEK